MVSSFHWPVLVRASWSAAKHGVLDDPWQSLALSVSITTLSGYALCNQVETCSLSVQDPTLKVDHR